MTTGTEIELRAQSGTQASLPAKVHYAKALADSGLLPAAYRRQPANVLYAIEYGDMLGLSPMAAITGVHIIEGKPSASAGLISALVRRAGHKLRVSGDGKSATCQIIRADDPDFTFAVTWTLQRNEDGNPSAAEARLLDKNTWKNYPAAMLKSRAITQCARDACEEALFGLHYTPEELGAEVDGDGVVVAVVVGSDEEWLAATLRVIPEIGLDACRKLWRETFEKKRGGELADPDSVKVLDLLKARMEALANPQQDAETATAEAEATSPVAAVLDPEDPWALKIEEITEGDLTAAREALEELDTMLRDDTISVEHATAVEEAIVARFPDVNRRAAVAA